MNRTSTSPNNGNWPRSVKICIWLAVVLVVAGIGLLVFDLVQTKNSTDWGSPGIRGDFYGGHLAAASGLAGTLLFFAALLLQARELGFQREQLGLQLDEFKQSREAAEQQTMMLGQQTGVLRQQTSELRTQNANLKRQIGLTESKDEIQLIMSIANEVKQIEREVDSDPHRDLLDSGAPTRERQKLESLRESQERLVRFVARRIVLLFPIDPSGADVNVQIFFAYLPGRIHEFGFKSLEAAAFECNPLGGGDPRKTPLYSWVQGKKLLILENLL